MKILLVCAGGMSTSILMKKMMRYAESQGWQLEIEARGINDYLEVCKKYDCILLGPQISYQKANVLRDSDMPADVIAPQDYGIGNCEHIFAQVRRLIPKQF